MRKIIFLLIALHGLVFGSGDFLTIDEYKTDVYFANGILTEHNASVSNTLLLEKAIRIKRFPRPQTVFGDAYENINYKR